MITLTITITKKTQLK